ncbi:MAG: exosortase T [Rickettsiales bacterium]
MMTTHKHNFLHFLPRLLLVSAIAVLACEPVLWLLGTWQDPAYDSSGFYLFAVCAGLFIWSVTSPRTTCQPVQHRYAFALLGATAIIRLIGQVFAINVIGALALVIDVYALAYLSATHLRKRPISPFWLAACFAFTLPLERILQRSIGYGLQHISADTACFMLGNFFDTVACEGVRIFIEGKDVLVDLPCSGARALLLLLFFFCMAAAICRSSFKMNLAGVVLVLGASLLINALRISVLAVGIAHPEAGIDVMAQPWHDIIGLSALAQGCIPIYFWAKYAYVPLKRVHPVLDQVRWTVPRSVKRDGWWLESKPRHRRIFVPVFTSLGFLCFAIAIISQPRHAIDVGKRDLAIALPTYLQNTMADPVPLLAKEEAYFTQYGGAAKKARYGDHHLLMIRTSSPLRHLHAPDECLRGLGFDVAYQGMHYAPIPTAVYKATDPQGQSYRVAVTFQSDNGHMTTNVSEAVWQWMLAPEHSWRAIQRISPWEAPQAEWVQFDRAVMAAFDLQPGMKNQPTQYVSIEGETHE